MNILSADFIKSVVDPAQLPEDSKPHIAMLGRSNVGKSTLINSLTGKKDLSRTSSTPGRTQLVNLFKINNLFYLVDLPGYGFAKVPAGKRDELQHLIFDYLANAARLKLAIVIIDGRHGPTALDIQMLMHLEENDIPFLVIANKMDKLSQKERAGLTKDLQQKLPGARILPHSAVTKEGRGEILDAIQEACRA